jgi:ABC-type amino acid transport substrate-binding protein
MTEEYPPYNYTENGKLKGISVDLMEEIFKYMGSNLTVNDIKVFPWSRAYALIKMQRNTMLFSTIKTEYSEKLFKWAGPIDNTRIALITKKSRNVKINSINDMAEYKIGVIKDDIGKMILLSKGLKKDTFKEFNNIKSLIKKLASNRIDLWLYESKVAKWILKNSGEDPEDYEEVYILKASDLYFAFHKDTPDSFINKFQESLEAVKAAH